MLGLELLIAAGIAWLLFGIRLKIRIPMGKKLAEYPDSLYVIHFPILLLAQSLLIFTNSTSAAAAVVSAVLSTGAVMGVAFIGGIIERKKSTVQNWLYGLTSVG